MELPFNTLDYQGNDLTIRVLPGAAGTKNLGIELNEEQSEFDEFDAKHIVSALEAVIKECDPAYVTKAELQAKVEAKMPYFEALQVVKETLRGDKQKYEIWLAEMAKLFLERYQAFLAENDYSATSRQDITEIAKGAAGEWMFTFTRMTKLLE